MSLIKGLGFLLIIALAQCTHQTNPRSARSETVHGAKKELVGHAATSENPGEDQAKIDSIIRSKTTQKKKGPLPNNEKDK